MNFERSSIEHNILYNLRTNGGIDFANEESALHHEVLTKSGTSNFYV